MEASESGAWPHALDDVAEREQPGDPPNASDTTAIVDRRPRISRSTLAAVCVSATKSTGSMGMLEMGEDGAALGAVGGEEVLGVDEADHVVDGLTIERVGREAGVGRAGNRLPQALAELEGNHAVAGHHELPGRQVRRFEDVLDDLGRLVGDGARALALGHDPAQLGVGDARLGRLAWTDEATDDRAHHGERLGERDEDPLEGPEEAEREGAHGLGWRRAHTPVVPAKVP